MRLQYWRRQIIILAFAIILAGYFLKWLPHPTAGLSFIGIDIGEWVKFLPEVRAGELGITRNAFYLPPITLSLMMVGWSLQWPARRWQNWAFNILALLISMLSLPSIEAVVGEPTSEWLARILLVSLVVLAVAASYFSKFFSRKVLTKVQWFSFLALGLIGAIFPTVTYLMIREPVSNLLRESIGIGPGVWLNAVGHLLLVAISLYALAINNDQPFDERSNH